MALVNAYIEKLDKKLHEQNKITEYLEKAEKATGVRRLYIALGEFLPAFHCAESCNFPSTTTLV